MGLETDAKFEALLMVDEETEYFDAQQQLQSSTVSGFYVLESASETETIEAGEIVLISENGETPQLSEITLAQELFHSYQDKQLRIERYERTTEEDSRRIDGVIEGDGNYVDYRYEQRCGSEWTCFQPSSGDGDDGGSEGGTGTQPNLGLLVYSFVQYSEGPAWIQSLYQQGGWDAVDRTYANPPESTEQYIHPDKYLQDSSTNVTVEDRSNEEWYVPQLEGGVNYATFGEAGMYSMLWYASPAVPRNDILTERQLDPYDYAHPASDGWDGDKLYPYVTDESNETGEMGYVWKSEWDTPGDAREFADAYRAALEGSGDPVDGRANTWRLPESHPFNDAFYVTVDGSTVTIVNAPTVAELSEVRSGAAPTVETPTPSADGDGAATATATTTATATGTEGTSPGFGVVVALAALAASILLARRR
jgi:PGF-CTERM protein